MSLIGSFVMSSMQLLAILLICAIGLGIVVLAVLYYKDVNQSENTIRRNYPVVGRFRAFFEHLGEFFRQYFFAMDREEMPFNRAERSWVYRAAKGVDNTVAFGSTRNIFSAGTILFENTPYPTLDEDAVEPELVVIGEGYCEQPYATKSLFNISAMSYGAISKPAVQALSKGAKKAGAWLNTGEGGLAPYHLEGGCDVVFQIGTGNYGVRDTNGKFSAEKLKQVAAHEQVKMTEIKISQGAKPGKGGILPGIKVTTEVAQIRGIPAGEDSISPNRHVEIENDNELLEFIASTRKLTGKPVGIKAVLGGNLWITRLCEAIQEKGLEYAPDFFTVDGGDGGTGAAPMSLMDTVGLPLKESLPFLVNELIRYDLRARIKVIASGKLVNPSEVAWALCTGADFVNSARGPMMALGCIQAMQCNKNTCPTGITTHQEKYQKGLNVTKKSDRVAQYIKQMVYEIGHISHSVGLKEPRELDRTHARMMGENGVTVELTSLYPYPNYHLNRETMQQRLKEANH
ncbi:MAG: glutamate synthase domain-containing protein 2 [Saprospiraceae bacterium]|jgi:glutamate synthase domain-containing protein 2